MRPQNDRREWHLDKTISVGHLLSTLVIAISVFSWASALDRRVEQNAMAISFLDKGQEQSQKRHESLRSEIKTDLRSINAKLDRLIEKGHGKQQ